MLLKVTTLALLPALIIQAYRVKKNTPKLPEPDGLREGRTGMGKKLSILIVGDSAAAGVGVTHQDDALSGAVIHALKAEFDLHWKLQAKTGDGSKQIRRAIHQLPPQQYDVVICSVGVNDVTRLMSPATWIKLQKRLYADIQTKFQAKLIIATAVPPMHLFPALKQPLAWLFGRYAKQMNQGLAQLVASTANMQWIEYDIAKYQALNLAMAADGFHPSREIYTLWGQAVAEQIRAVF